MEDHEKQQQQQDQEENIQEYVYGLSGYDCLITKITFTNSGETLSEFSILVLTYRAISRVFASKFYEVSRL